MSFETHTVTWTFGSFQTLILKLKGYFDLQEGTANIDGSMCPCYLTIPIPLFPVDIINSTLDDSNLNNLTFLKHLKFPVPFTLIVTSIIRTFKNENLIRCQLRSSVYCNNGVTVNPPF